MTGSMKALVVEGRKEAAVKDVSIPKVKPDWVLVKTTAVALNPTDWKHIDFMAQPGAKVGCDYAGIVEEVGDKVTSNVKKGDRIAGMVHGANSGDFEDGAFGEYLTAKDGIWLRIPSGLSDAEAATLGVGVTTVGQALYQSLKLPLPTAPASQPFPLLIYGGSTATGALAIQYAKLSGARVIATASKHNHEYLTSLGADAVFDYKDPEGPAAIRKYAPDLHLALDNIASESSARFCSESLAPSTPVLKNVVTFLLPREAPGDDVESRHTLGYTAFGRPFPWREGQTVDVQEGHYEFAREFWAISEKLFAEGKLRVHRPEVRKGGLEGILGGLDDLRNDRVSGVKLVYEL